jgi:hypothetical protein
MDWWWEWFDQKWDILTHAYSLADGKLFDHQRVRELWISPSIINPVSAMNPERLHSVHDNVKIKPFHHHQYVRDHHLYVNGEDKKRMLTTGFRALGFFMHYRELFNTVSIVGFGTGEEGMEDADKYHYYGLEMLDSPRIFDACHRLDYEHKITKEWIDKGLLRRLEDNEDRNSLQGIFL